MKSLIVYYSMEGHTKLIAQLIEAEAGADVYQLKPIKEKRRSGFGKYFWGGKSVVFNEKPQLEGQLPNLDDYDIIFIGTPVWASSYTPPINTFLADCQLNAKKIMLFVCHAGGGGKKTFEKLKMRLPGCEIIGEIDFKDPLEKDIETYKANIQKWLSDAGLHS